MTVGLPDSVCVGVAVPLAVNVCVTDIDNEGVEDSLAEPVGDAVPLALKVCVTEPL